MDEFSQERHKNQTPLERPRELVLACAPLRSNVNLSRIARAAGCWGVRRLVCCGTAKIVQKIARDASQTLELDVHRTLAPVLKKLRADGYELVGLEQTTNSQSIFDFAFERRTVLVVGNERHGIDESILAMMDRVVEIPVYGMPYSHNAASSAIMGMYEYCRQFPTG